MNHLSYWEQDAELKKVDVAVIGAGFVGSYAALFLARACPHLQIAVVDKDVLHGGASTRNAGFGCFGSVSEILSSIDQYSEAAVIEILKDRYLGLQTMRETLGDHHIEYQDIGGYEMFKSEDQELFDRCAHYLPKLNAICKSELGLNETYQIKNNSLADFGLRSFNKVIFNQYEGGLHPVKALSRLHDLCKKEDVLFHDKFEVMDILHNNSGICIRSENRALNAKKVIVATNGFSSKLFPSFDVTPARNMVLITHPIDRLKINGTFHYDEGYIYFRHVGDRILLGGGRNQDLVGEQTAQLGLNHKIQSHLTRFLLEDILPGYDENIIDYWWSGIMGVGEQLHPEITWIDDHILTGVRLNGMGVALSSLVGQKIAHKMADVFN